MARRPTTPPPPTQVELAPDAMRKGVQKLERRLKDLQEVAPEQIENHWEAAESLATRTNDSLAEIFGMDSVQYSRAHISAHSFSVGRVSFGGHGPSRAEKIEAFKDGVRRSIKKLQTEIEIFQEKLVDSPDESWVEPPATDVEPVYSDDEIFVVHGQDEAAKQEVARFLEKSGLRPLILHELDNQGNTIIEKFERHTANIGFAVVLLTPDDVGGRDAQNLQPRARQNVVAELFYFMGKLGRARVAALKKGKLEIPSDIAGVVYIDMDVRGAWKNDLVRELRAAKYEGDWAKALIG